MRSIKVPLLALTALVASALAIPAVASANWTSEGAGLTGPVWTQEGSTLESNGSLSLEGEFAIESGFGGFECPLSATASLYANSSSGRLSDISIDAVHCELEGLLQVACDEVVSGGSQTEAWNFHGTESGGKAAIKVNKVTLLIKLAGEECTESGELDLTLEGSLILGPDDADSIDSLAFSGELETDFGNAAVVSNPMSVTPAGQYGISNQHTVAVEGTLGFNSAAVGMTCPVSGVIALEPGDEGQVTSLDWDAEDCELSGILSEWYGTNGVQAVVSRDLPWTVVAGPGTIEVSDFSPEIKFSSSETWLVDGEMTAEPDENQMISSTSLSGEPDSSVGKLTWGGSLDWTPAGKYGIE